MMHTILLDVAMSDDYAYQVGCDCGWEAFGTFDKTEAIDVWEDHCDNEFYKATMHE